MQGTRDSSVGMDLRPELRSHAETVLGLRFVYFNPGLFLLTLGFVKVFFVDCHDRVGQRLVLHQVDVAERGRKELSVFPKGFPLDFDHLFKWN